jgi:hypothetical protein
MRARDGSLHVDPEEIKVSPEHLGELEKIHDLLRELNDPYAAGRSVGALIAKIPILAARCVHRAQSRSSKIEVQSLTQALSLIGNRGLEAELLDLLEDLTVAKDKLEKP